MGNQLGPGSDRRPIETGSDSPQGEGSTDGTTPVPSVPLDFRLEKALNKIVEDRSRLLEMCVGIVNREGGLCADYQHQSQAEIQWAKNIQKILNEIAVDANVDPQSWRVTDSSGASPSEGSWNNLYQLCLDRDRKILQELQDESVQPEMIRLNLCDRVGGLIMGLLISQTSHKGPSKAFLGAKLVGADELRNDSQVKEWARLGEVSETALASFAECVAEASTGKDDLAAQIFERGFRLHESSPLLDVRQNGKTWEYYARDKLFGTEGSQGTIAWEQKCRCNGQVLIMALNENETDGNRINTGMTTAHKISLYCDVPVIIPFRERLVVTGSSMDRIPFIEIFPWSDTAIEYHDITQPDQGLGKGRYVDATKLTKDKT